MSEYTSADGKSDRFLVSYQSVRGADLKAIASAIQETTPLSELYSTFVKPTDDGRSVVDDAVSFLHAIDMVEKTSERTVEPIAEQPFEHYPFELRVLYHLGQQDGTQEHFSRIHDVLVEQDTRRYDKYDLEEDLERELDEYELDWNVEKVQIWYNLVAPLGLISVRDNEEILTSPTPAVLYELLSRFEEEVSSSKIREAFDWIEDNFFDCYTEHGGHPRIHAGLNDTVGTLLRDGVLELEAPSDATSEIVVPDHKADRVSRFELSDRPDRPSYRFPLDVHEEVTA